MNTQDRDVPEIECVVGDDFAAWLTEMLAALDLDRVHIVGLSYGGRLALNQAVCSPDAIASVTVVDPVGALGRPKTSFVLGIVPDSLPALARSEKAVLRLLARLINGAVPTQFLLDLSIAGLRTFVGKQPVPRRISDDDLRRITVPTLLLLCARSPVNLAPRDADRARRCISGIEVEVVRDSGHMLPIETPDEFATRRLRFVDGVDRQSQ